MILARCFVTLLHIPKQNHLILSAFPAPESMHQFGFWKSQRGPSVLWQIKILGNRVEPFQK
jgi:hypothetical protein